MVLTRIEEGAAALKDESCSRHEVRDVARSVRLHGAKILVAQAVTNVEPPSELPGILNVRVKGVDVHKAFRITNSNGRAAGKVVGNGMEVVASGNIAGEEVGQSLCYRGFRCGHRITSPRAGGTVEDELSCSAAMIELIEFPVAEFGSVAELVLSDTVGNDVGKVQGKVASALGRRQTNLFKSTGAALGRRRDDDIGSAVDGLPMGGGVRTKEYSHGLGVEAIVVVVEELVEVAGAKKELIGPPRGQRGVQNCAIVSIVERRHFKIVRQIGAGRSQGRTAAQWCSLVALPDDGVERKMMFVRNLVINPSNTVVAIAKLGAGAEEVASCSRQATDCASRPEAARSNGGLGCGTFWSVAMGGKHCQSLVHPRIRGFRCNSGKTKHEVILLVASKGKCLVLNNRTARGEPVVFVAFSWSLSARRR